VVGRRSWMVAAVVAAGMAVVTGGVGVVSATTRTGCEVTYTVTSQWANGFGVDLRVRNTGSLPVDTWSLSWKFTGGQRVLQGWNAGYTQSGPTVTARSAAWNARIPAGGRAQTGFVGISIGANPSPEAFTLNGVTCTVTGAPADRPTSAPGTTTPGTTTPAPMGTGIGTAPTSTTAPAATTTTSRPVVTTTTAAPSATGASGPTMGAGRIQYGPTYTGEGTFYGATGQGSCSYEATTDRMIAAMNQTDYQNSQACGAHLSVTGPSGTTITVEIVDRCPKCKPGDIDLSAEAFAKLAVPSAGRIRISWKLLSPARSGPVAYKYKDGSTRYWCGIQVRNHRNPVRSLEVQVNGTWKSLPRQAYNYFLSADGTGCGGTVRVTDIYGHQLVDSGIAIKPAAVQQGSGQFGAPS
jgi:expansin (peptidoglycan-binding protein)